LNISLNDSEIKTAIENYVTKSGFDTVGKDIDITISVGRKGNGAKAEVVITDKEESQKMISEGANAISAPITETEDDGSLFGKEED